MINKFDRYLNYIPSSPAMYYDNKLGFPQIKKKR